jgi:hypothetical protein
MYQIIVSIIRWVARATALLLAIGFFAFAVGEPAGPWSDIHFREWVGMIFLLGAIVAMLLAWKWEFPAALFSVFLLAAFTAVVHWRRYDLLLIAALPNILFLLDWKLRRLHSVHASHAK